MRRWTWLVCGGIACAGSKGGTARFEAQLPPAALPNGAHDACGNGVERIIATPDTHSRYVREGLVQYTEVETGHEEGLVIPIFASSEVSAAQILRARELLRFYLRDHPGSSWGHDKSGVAVAMADSGAVLVMPNGAHEEGNEPRVPAQPLYDHETPVAGDDWFMTNDYAHRDAAFEEIFHLVHDNGIGTQPGSGALPDYQDALLAEALASLEDGRWGIPVDPEVSRWIEELRREGSLAQEYIASVIDSWYGLWGPWDEDAGGMWGIYIAKTRAEVESFDPVGGALLSDFLPGQLTTVEPIDADFSGTLSLAFDPAELYTHKTQYFTSVRVLGDGPITVVGNAADNAVVAGPGELRFDGGEGEDTLVVCHTFEEVEVDGDTVVGPAGQVWTLNQVETVHLLDAVVDLSESPSR